MTRICDWLTFAEAQLKTAGVLSARLDAELLLSDLLQKPKTWLLAHNNEFIPQESLDILTNTLTRRLDRQPLAYIRGQQEFYGRAFIVNRNVLIPRPETEALIEELQTIPIKDSGVLIDVGTGSGCIAITAKLEYPQLKVYGLDISHKALLLAAKNAANLHAGVTFMHSNLLTTRALPKNSTIIVANLPYVGHDWQVSPEVNFEPSEALYADNNGLKLIFDLLTQAASLGQESHLLLEADPCQHHAITDKACALGFRQRSHKGFMIHFQKD